MSEYVEEALAQAILEIEGDPITLLPELVKEGEWEVIPITNLGGKTNLLDNVMQVPTGLSDIEAAVRLHEMGHAKWTKPEDTHLLTSDIGEFLQVVEDMRIHHLLGETIGHWSLYGDAMIDTVQERYKSGFYGHHREDIVCMEIASRQNDSGPVLPLSAEDKAFVDLIQDEIKNDPSSEKAVELARVVRDYLYPPGDEESEEGEPNPSPEGDSEDGDNGEANSPDNRPTDSDSSEEEEEVKPQPKPAKKRNYGRSKTQIDPWSPKGKVPLVGKGYQTSEPIEWAPMDILTPALELGMDRSKVTRRARKNLKEGTFPRNVSRVLTDRKVFQKKTKRERSGGTVLVDISGSMSLSDDDLERIVAKTKHGIVACYNGKSHERRGFLAILAKNWMRVANVRLALPYFGGNNLVDGPAIRWLAKQQQPRVWISDAEVNGITPSGYADTSIELAMEVDALTQRYKITRYRNIRAYLDDIVATDTARDRVM